MPPTPEPFDLPALRERIESVRRDFVAVDQNRLEPEALVHLHLAMNALEAARLHVEAARLVPRVGTLTRKAAPYFARAFAILGSEAKAREWLERPNRGLGGSTPISLLETTSGALRVEEALSRLQEGHFG